MLLINVVVVVTLWQRNYKKIISTVERTNEILMPRVCRQQVPHLSGRTKSCFKVKVGVSRQGDIPYTPFVSH